MDILFYTTLSMLILLAPLFIRAEGTFSPDRKLAYLTIRLFFLKVVSFCLYFHEEGPMISLNGKRGKPIRIKSQKSSGKRIFKPYLQMIRIKECRVTAYTGGETGRISLGLGTLLVALGEGLEYLKRRGILDRGSVTLLPCYTGEMTTVNFSITFFSSLAQILAAFVHTKGGKDYGERSDRQYDGEDA